MAMIYYNHRDVLLDVIQAIRNRKPFIYITLRSDLTTVSEASIASYIQHKLGKYVRGIEQFNPQDRAGKYRLKVYLA